MLKRNIIAYILCGVFLVGSCTGIGMMTNTVIGTMVEAAAYELNEMGSVAPDESIGGSDTDIDSEHDNTEPGSTEPTDSNSDSAETNPTETKPNDENSSDVTEPTDDSSDETTPGETEPVETVPGETEGDSSDDTGDGVPSDTDDIENTQKPSGKDDATDVDSNVVCDHKCVCGYEIDGSVYVLVEYLIQWGDTLSELAEEYGTTVSMIANLNNIKNIDLIYAGDKILIPMQVESCVCCDHCS